MKWACTQWLDAGVSLTAVCTCTVPRFHWGRAGMSVGPSKAALHRRELHWPLGAIQQNICTITDIVIYHRHHSSDPNIGGTVTFPGSVHWVLRNPDVGVSGLMLLFPGECGWMVVLYFFFFFCLQILGASGTAVIVYFKAFVSLSFVLHRDIECVSNEWKAHQNSMLVFLWDHFGVFLTD